MNFVYFSIQTGKDKTKLYVSACKNIRLYKRMKLENSKNEGSLIEKYFYLEIKKTFLV